MATIDISTNDPYITGYIVEFPTEGEQLLLRDKLAVTGNTLDEWYTVIENDRIDLIAFKKYDGKIEHPARYWWVIADANNIHNPLDLSSWVGKDILIPDIQKVLLNI